MKIYCTYFDSNYGSRGLTLYRSLEKHSDEPFEFWVLCLDDEIKVALEKLRISNITLITLDHFYEYDPDIAALREMRSGAELIWSYTASWPLYVMANAVNAEYVTYLDADMMFFSSPASVYEEMGDKSVLIHEHRYSLAFKKWEKSMGRFNVGLMVFRNAPHALKVLNDWRKDILCWLPGDCGRATFADQIFLDKWPDTYECICITKNQGIGVANWNMESATLVSNGSSICINNTALMLFHYHSFSLCSRRLCKLADHGYLSSLTAKIVKIIYVPYIKELQKAEDCLALKWPFFHYPIHPTVALLDRTLFLYRPYRAGLLVWKVAYWQRGRRYAARIYRNRACSAFNEGDYLSCQYSCLRMFLANPFLIFNRHLLSLFFKSFFKSFLKS